MHKQDIFCFLQSQIYFHFIVEGTTKEDIAQE